MMVFDWLILVQWLLILDSYYLVFFLVLPGVSSRLCCMTSFGSTDCIVCTVAASFFFSYLTKYISYH